MMEPHLSMSSSRRHKHHTGSDDDTSLSLTKINRHISISSRWRTRRTNNIFNSFTILCTSLALCLLIVLACMLGKTSAQDLSDLNFQSENVHHRIRRYAENPQPLINPQGGFTDIYPSFKGDTLPQTANLGNVHKPNFTNCATYQPQIYEEQAPGATVVHVIATDRDPYDIGGKITYSLVDAGDSFYIDPDTGIVTTRKQFDRDEPAKEKEVHLTVKATDNGRPSLEAVCTIKVKILDINDNRPAFDKYNYRESIPEDLEIRKVVVRISASDIDDGNNGTVIFKLDRHPSSPDDINYFDIIQQTGEITLKKKLEDMRHKPQYFLQAIASDRGTPSLSSVTNVTFDIVESSKKPPTIEDHVRHFTLPETSTDKSKPILVLTAHSNTPDGKVFFEILNGPTESSNKDNHFTLETDNNKAFLKLDKDLDYESVTRYTLTIRAENRFKVATETLVTVEVSDENDVKPIFSEAIFGSILENEPAQSYVTKVRATDNDGTSPNNEVKYYLTEEDRGNFRIDENTGEIWSMREFDRETEEIFQVKVIARDGAPSVLTRNGLPNNRTVNLKIEIKDKNDNPPIFVKPRPASIEEDANIKTKVIEVRADDADIESKITYSIVEGDPDNYFGIESTTTSGIIYVKKLLDFETTQSYRLKIKASDSLHEAFTFVDIQIINVNDNPPKWVTQTMNYTMVEESLPPGCIFRVEAYDPDIQDRTLPQNIVYFLDKGKDNFRISVDGCVTIFKKLDRDPPNGYPISQIIVGAHDEGGKGTRQTSYLELSIVLTDINDNAPFINSTNPVVWDENRPAGLITTITADDYDEPKNGAPFHFRIDPSAPREIADIFTLNGNELRTNKDNFDRELQKTYKIPIQISDSGTPNQFGTSILTVIIGDKNDNRMSYGKSKIFMYKYKDVAPVLIGRVYVKDEDDWDLPDKDFHWRSGTPHHFFNLDKDTGNIEALPSVEAGTYHLEFTVIDRHWQDNADADVEVVVKQITDEAVDNSGSIRFYGITKEEFITKGSDGRSKQDILRTEIARIFGIQNEDNVDVFTILNSPHNSDPKVLDVRYSAHNSPYYKAEKLDGKMSDHKDALEKALGVQILLIRVDECLQERYLCESSCTNKLYKSDKSISIQTNETSFVGVNAYVDPVCQCAAKLIPTSCDVNPCLYGGICQSGYGIDGFRCECQEGFHGQRCEVSSIHLNGNAYAWFPPLSVCSDSVLVIYFQTTRSNALLMYNGPTMKSSINVTDFMSLELNDGQPRLLMDYGSGVRELSVKSPKLSDGQDHYITLRWTETEISMAVDDCQTKNPSCYKFGEPVGSHAFLNVNGPLQLGGLSFDVEQLRGHMRWTAVPTMEKFAGCITNLSLNGQFYNLREPSYASENVTTCDSPLVGVIVAGPVIGMTFIIIIIICLLILIILILSVVFYRRRKTYEEIKTDPADDVRENIMKYDDDGGGEGDANYNLALLGRPYRHPQSPTDKIPLERLYPVGRSIYSPDEPDLQSFVEGNKDRADRDPEGLPFDDVRNYAYEGDGNSMGSLSSLASGTDDSDLNLDFLPSFGPRFKKLADMYGGNSSDDSSSTYSGAGA